MPVPATVPRSLALACCIILAASQLPGIFSGVLFAWHPVLMSVGFLGLMTEGILRAVAFRNLEGMQRVRAIQRHAWIQAGASACIALGFAAIYANKVRNNKIHFTSLHGKVGLLALLAAALAPLGGVFSFRKLGLVTHLPEPWQPVIKWMHRCVGALVWVLALAVMQLPLPHAAVFQGVLCRVWQLLVLGLAASMLTQLRGDGKRPLLVIPLTDMPSAADTGKHR